MEKQLIPGIKKKITKTATVVNKTPLSEEKKEEILQNFLNSYYKSYIGNNTANYKEISTIEAKHNDSNEENKNNPNKEEAGVSNINPMAIVTQVLKQRKKKIKQNINMTK